MLEEKENLSKALSSADRFIPTRKGNNFEFSSYLIDSRIQCNKENVDLKHEWNKQLYQRTLWSNLFGPVCRGILNFSDSVQNSNCGVVTSQLWPVKVRKKPILGAPPVTILDMPGVRYDNGCSLMDWSKLGDLACIYDQEVYIWRENIQASSVITDTRGRIEKTIKWNHDGTLLALGLIDGRVGIWNVKKRKIVSEDECRCIKKISPKKCFISAFAWTRRNELFSACSNGHLIRWKVDFWCICNISAHKGGVTSMYISCNERYIATAGFDDYLKIWKLSNLMPCFVFHGGQFIEDISWHPTKESLLVFALDADDGQNLGSTLILLNVLSDKYVAQKMLIGQFVVALSFCPFSGELVVSSFTQSGVYCVPHITVYSDFDTKVDGFSYHNDKVTYLLWNKATQQLATAGTDENLCIWNFREKSKGNNADKSRKPASVLNPSFRF